MPERPDLEYVVDVLRSELTGATIDELVVRKPVVLRMALAGDPLALCRGRRFEGVLRRGHFVRFGFDGTEPPLEIVVSPMLAGVFALEPAGRKMTADVAVAWTLGDGRQLRYRDNKQMGKVYLILGGDHERVPGLCQAGVDVLDPSRFTREAFRALARERRDQVRVFLMDKAALDSLGNAYADEVLWAAGIHPKTWVRSLGDDELDALHDAIVQVLGTAVATIAARKPALHEKLRDFLQVRNRAGQPCPRCQTTLRRAGVRGYDAHFCPRCQPDRRGSSIVDWRKLDR